LRGKCRGDCGLHSYFAFASFTEAGNDISMSAIPNTTLHFLQGYHQTMALLLIRLSLPQIGAHLLLQLLTLVCECLQHATFRLRDARSDEAHSASLQGPNGLSDVSAILFAHPSFGCAYRLCNVVPHLAGELLDGVSRHRRSFVWSHFHFKKKKRRDPDLPQ
jgi:hypothetical protein